MFQFRRPVLLMFIFFQFLLKITDSPAYRYLFKAVDAYRIGNTVPVEIKCRNDPAVARTLDKYDSQEPYGYKVLQIFPESSFRRV